MFDVKEALAEAERVLMQFPTSLQLQQKDLNDSKQFPKEEAKQLSLDMAFSSSSPLTTNDFMQINDSTLDLR